MPQLDLARLARDLTAMRSGHGSRRHELRQLLASVDPELRRRRNIETLRLAQLRHQLSASDTRRPPDAISTLQQAAGECARRLAVLDRRILEAIAAGKK